MTLLALGINHKTAPVAIRERVAFAPDRIESALREVVDQSLADEVAILSTCNRTELYCSVRSGEDAPRLVDWISRYHGVDREALVSCVYLHRERDAVMHMMRVASGLDSLVLGEPQILGQVKDAYAFAQAAGTLGGRWSGCFSIPLAWPNGCGPKQPSAPIRFLSPMPRYPWPDTSSPISGA
ncbi:hypothetical protein AAIA72_00440 [Hahella sp. SMD15-11]|uniref:Glutamyl-tRNA reductase N-terminal domain-containing protein n=1 Tax=Thermohahella caldifontis TaxID=3142973 RepID=A0AB39UVV4_9GAMM